MYTPTIMVSQLMVLVAYTTWRMPSDWRALIWDLAQTNGTTVFWAGFGLVVLKLARDGYRGWQNPDSEMPRPMDDAELRAECLARLERGER